MSEESRRIGQLLEAQLGDNLVRCWRYMQKLDYTKMWEPWAATERPAFEILADYIADEIKARRALRWLAEAEKAMEEKEQSE